MTDPVSGARRGRPKLKKSERKIPLRGSLSPDAMLWLDRLVRAQSMSAERAEVYDVIERARASPREAGDAFDLEHAQRSVACRGCIDVNWGHLTGCPARIRR